MKKSKNKKNFEENGYIVLYYLCTIKKSHVVIIT